MGIKLKPYPEYKESGVPWLGRIPVDWRVLRSRYVFREVDSRSTTGAEEHLSMSQQHGLIPSSRLSEHRLLSESYLGGKLCERGDIVLNRLKAHLGVFAAASQPGVISPDYTVLRPKQQISAKYFEFLLRTPLCRTECAKRVKGVVEGFWRLYTDSFYSISLPMPPFEVQESIVDYLQSFDRILGKLIRLKRHMIDLLTEQKQAIIHRAVTRGIDPNVRLKPSGIDWLGDIPAHWELKRAKQVCDGIVDCKNRTPDMVMGGEYTVVRTTNIRNGEFHPAGSYSTDRQNFEIWTQRGAPRAGDVFFTREAPVGEACLVPEQGNLCMGQRMMYFRPDNTMLDSNFMLNNIYGPLVRRYIEIESNGSTVGHLRLGQVSALPLLWCPLDEQRKIVAYIGTESTPLNTATLRLAHEIDLLREYRTRLIADVVTGKLDVRGVALPDLAEAPAAWDDGDPTEEPPEEESAPED